ncbi:hypothetical protein BDN72DRAFT_151929 [Pluteus cervinus]|uniref:Uncharacterized protein n=1 Tax=Pluteus cervinus TaxID=181527 RepID=A0ACD3B6X0_9AGAR|nr:hypothetical protein BDN72DRAFT_151929 [Pluteus cervinus]
MPIRLFPCSCATLCRGRGISTLSGCHRFLKDANTLLQSHNLRLQPLHMKIIGNLGQMRQKPTCYAVEVCSSKSDGDAESASRATRIKLLPRVSAPKWRKERNSFR